jgi:hypothetical protein
MSNNIDYKNKYLKYKLKYLFFKNHKGGNKILDQEQNEFHRLLNELSENTYISGFTGVFQWHNNVNNTLHPKTVTLFGEYHQKGDDFKDCNFQDTGDKEQINHPNKINLEILYKLFKGTRQCIDFYLEDDATEDKTFDPSAESPIPWTLANIQDYHVDGFLLKNLREMTIKDMYISTGIDQRKRNEFKLFKNIRMHYTEFRVFDGSSILFPPTICKYNTSPSDYKFQHWNFYSPKRTLQTLINSLYQDGIANGRFHNFLKDIREFFFNLAGIYHDKIDINQANDLYILYEKIFEHYGKDLNRLKIEGDITRDFNRYLWIMKKNVKNIKKYDSINKEKYIYFFKKYLDYPAIFAGLKKNIPNFFYNFDKPKLFYFLTKLDITLIDIYTISRSLKIFSMKDQSINLNKESLCFNNQDLFKRNILYYHGYSHTNMYYLFWKYYFGRDSDYGLTIDSEIIHFHFIYNNIIKYEAGEYKIVKTDFKENLDDFILQPYIEWWARGTDGKWNMGGGDVIDVVSLFRDPHAKIGNDNRISNNSKTVQCVRNYMNIFKKILINISKEGNERVRLLNQLDMNKYSSIDNIIESSFNKSNNKIIKISFNNIKKIINNKFNNNKYQTVIDTNFSLKNGNTISAENINHSILYNDSIYSKDTFRGILDENMELKPSINKDNPEKIDKLELESIVTNFFTKYFLKDVSKQLNFYDFIGDLYDNCILIWNKLAQSKIIRDNPEVFANIPDVEIDKYNLVSFIYKGSRPIMHIYSQFKKQFPLEINSFISSNYDEYFSLSNNDFMLLINIPNLFSDDEVIKSASRVLFKKLYNEISLLNYIILREITNVFNDETKSKYIFNYLSEDNYNQKLLLKEIFDSFNKVIRDRQATAQSQAGVLEAQSQAGVLGTQSQGGVSEAQPQAEVLEAQSQAGVLGTQSQGGVSEAQPQAGVSEAQSQAEVLEAQPQGGVSEAQSQAGVSEAQSQAGVLGAQSQAGVLGAQPQVAKPINMENYLYNISLHTIMSVNEITYPPNMYDLIDNSYKNPVTDNIDHPINNHHSNIFMIKNRDAVKRDGSIIDAKNIYNADILLDMVDDDLYVKMPYGSFYTLYNHNIINRADQFSLSQIKFNFRTYGKNNNTSDNVFFNIGAEVANVSISYYKENYYYSEDNLTIYDIKHNNLNYNYHGLNLSSIIDDLIQMLFKQTVTDNVFEQTKDSTFFGMPWNENKYDKLLRRCMLLIFIELYDCKTANTSLCTKNKNIKDILTDFSALLSDVEAIQNPHNFNNKLIAFMKSKLDRTDDELQLVSIDPDDLITKELNYLYNISTSQQVPSKQSARSFQDGMSIDKLEKNIYYKLMKINGLFGFLYYLSKMIIFYTIDYDSKEGYEWNYLEFKNFIETIKLIVKDLIKLMKMIIAKKDFKFNEEINEIVV